MSNPNTYPTLSVPENGTFVYTFNITMDGINLLPLVSITTLTLTIIDTATGLIINAQNKANAKNTNGVAIASTGAATWTPAPLDNAIVELNPNALDGDVKTHEAIFQWTWLDGGGRTLQLQTKVFVNVEKFAATETPPPAGTGLSQVTINLGQPNIEVWITTDAIGNVRAAGTLITDFRGFATFQLINGAQYYLWTSGDGFLPTLGQPFIATADIAL
jgi:hypothetical protein